MNSLQRFLDDTRGVDTIPLKMVFYLSIAGLIIAMTILSWNNILPVIDDADINRQLDDSALAVSSIQNGYARDLSRNDISGSMCVIDFSLPENVIFVSFGVDPDPDHDGNLTNTAWTIEDNTVICGYFGGFRSRTFIDGDNIRFRKGTPDNEGYWSIAENISSMNHDQGVVIEGPISGDLVFELVFVEGKGKYTLSHF